MCQSIRKFINWWWTRSICIFVKLISSIVWAVDHLNVTLNVGHGYVFLLNQRTLHLQKSRLLYAWLKLKTWRSPIFKIQPKMLFWVRPISSFLIHFSITCRANDVKQKYWLAVYYFFFPFFSSLFFFYILTL